MDKIISDVRKERRRQLKKWGPQKHSISSWHLILTEEWGEVSKEVNEVYFRNKGMKELRHELIQTIAVATRMIEEIDNW